MRWNLLVSALVLVAALQRGAGHASPGPAARTADVLTQHNDNARTGANLAETTLTTANVNVRRFGKIFTLPVGGQVYAQPLYVAGLRVGGARRNVVYVATMHNTVYAFDADRRATPLWRRTLGPSAPIVTTSPQYPRNSPHHGPYNDFGEPCNGEPYGVYHDIAKEVGIVGTPVIDRRTDTLYVVALVKRPGVDVTRRYAHVLHALDLRTGRDRQAPVETHASVAGVGVGNTNGVAEPLDNRTQMQRPALLLANGMVYVGFAGYCDVSPYHGWLLGYDAAAIRRPPHVLNTSPNGVGAGIWQSGWGPSADAAGNVYVITGNGSFDAVSGRADYGDTFLKLSPTLRVSSYFTPHNQAYIDANDIDLGSTGVMLLPGTRLIVGGSKEGKLYVLDRDRLGGFHRSDDRVEQVFQAATNTHTPILYPNIHGGTVYWRGPSGPPLVYVWGEDDRLKAYRFRDGRFDTRPAAESRTVLDSGMPGAMLSLSANRNGAGSGIVWASHPQSGNAQHAVRPGALQAFDASNVGRELWSSDQDGRRDAVGTFAKFSAPTVAGGKVYLATFSGYVDVYGLLPTRGR